MLLSGKLKAVQCKHHQQNNLKCSKRFMLILWRIHTWFFLQQPMPAIAIVQQLHIRMRYAVGFVLSRGRCGPSLWNWCCWFPSCPSLALHCCKRLSKKGLVQVMEIISQTEEVQGFCERWCLFTPRKWVLWQLSTPSTCCFGELAN